MILNIKPFEGVGDLKLGMTSDDIERIMGVKPNRFKKVIYDEFLTDQYETFFVYYKPPGFAEAFEFNNLAELLFNDKKLFAMSYSDLCDYIQNIDKNVELDSTGLTSYKYGIGIYAPYAETQPYQKPESIIVFEKGYYD